MERDKIPLLKLKFYCFSSADADQRQDHQQLPVEEKKDGSSTGPLTYASGLTIKINSYGVKINPSEFCKGLDQAKHLFKQEGPDQAVCGAMELSQQIRSPRKGRFE